MRLVVLGAPGAGKGTQARYLASYYKIQHISTGDILRNHMKKGTKIGVSITEIMNAGELVPDKLVIGLVKKHLLESDCKDGFILDGFPRTLEQAVIFDSLDFKIDYAINVEVEDDIIIERMSGRMVCPNCGAMYHTVYYPSKKEHLCNVCDTNLIQREDDKTLTVENRLRIYHELTEPIINYYNEKGILFTISGTGNIETITKDIIKFLEMNNDGN